MNLLIAVRNHFAGRVAAMVIATVFSTAISVALLPLATRTLHAADYGSYALLMSMVTLVGTAMDGGASLLLPALYGPASLQERRALFATMMTVAALGAGAFALVLLGIAFYAPKAWFGLAIPLDSILATAALMPMRTVTSIAVITFSTTGRSGAIALQMVVQSIFVFIATLIALFWLSLGGPSLIIGAAFGQLAALAVCLGTLSYHGELSVKPSRQWLRRSLRNAPTSAGAGFMDGARGFAENAFMTKLEGLHGAGILAHARLYYNFLMALVSSVAHSVQVKSLADARDPASPMNRTRSAWTPVHIALGGAGIFFALFATNVVNIISNGKLVEAAPYIPMFVVVALIQISEQPASAIVFASGKAGIAVRFRIVLTFCGLIALFPMISYLGIAGIVAVSLGEAVLYRLGLRLLARTVREVPFQDAVAYFACLATVATMLWANLTSPELYERIAWMIGGCFAVALAGRRSIKEIFVETYRFFEVWDKSRSRSTT
ncbi:MAG: hypothetical protein JSR61_00690 [Proteobacteria bacterium]|nr:hypothetical protein [Pseudomonadota bacterium]